MSFVSPLVEYKFYNQTSEQIYKKYFIDGSLPVEGTFMHIADVNSDISDEIKKTVKDFYYYNKIEPQYFAFTVIVFSSTEATKLKECFEVSKPLDNEILIFVEDNKNDSASGTYGAINISPKIITTLNSQNRLAYDVKDNKNIYDELKKIVPELTNDQIKSLLHNGYIEDTRINAIKTWLKIASFFSSGIDVIFPGLGILTNDLVRKVTSDSLGEVIEKIEEARLEEYRWQPTAPKTENGEADKNYNYQPLISADEKDNATINIAQFSSLLQKKLDEQDAFVKAKLKISQKFDEKGEPNNLLEFLYHNYFKAYIVAKSTISQIQELSDIEILKYGVKAYNALLCGVWNGLVDAVSGLFAMVKMIYDGITLGKDFVQNIDKYLPTLLEQFDEAIQAIEKLSFTEIAKYIYAKLKEVNLTFDPIACAYFVGYAYGFILSLIIEVIIGIIVSGGSLSIAAIVNGLVETIFGIFRLGFSAAKGVAKAIRTFSRFVVKSIEDVIKGFQELVNFLKKGWEEIRKVVDGAFKNVEIEFKEARKKKRIELFSIIKGKRINLQLLKKLQNEFEELGGKMIYDKESFEYITAREKVEKVEIEAITFNEELILLNKNVTTSAVYEELIHSKQFRSGLYDNWADKYGNEIAKNLMEKEAAEELIKRASEWKLPKEEIELIKDRLEFFNEELKILGYEN